MLPPHQRRETMARAIDQSAARKASVASSVAHHAIETLKSKLSSDITGESTDQAPRRQ
jgi:hypothetical protein